ncbi:MAG: response regulator transcription factor [Anaerolineales bacterium]|jgi:DNA-binding NarL/FixJ family response regulator
MPIRVLIADDHGIVREGLRMYLQWDSELEVVGEAADGKEAITLAEKLHPDIVLMDILMPRMDGLAATAAIRRSLPDTEVIALTSVLDDAVIRQAIRAGAIGYLLKDTGSDELCHAIHAAAGGQVQLSRSVAVRLLADQEQRTPLQPLTEREMEVLRQVALGHSNKEIALALEIAEKTVKAHVGSVLSKMGVASRTQAALMAVQSGLVRLDGNQET